MKIGWCNAIGVGPLLVIRQSETEWDVLTPDADSARVTEDPLEFGYFGPDWAVDAVLRAEQEYDRSETPTVVVSAAELEDAYRGLAAACLIEEACDPAGACGDFFFG